MTDEKITIERMRQLAGGDPFGVRGDPELQLAAIQAARVRYEEFQANADLDAWVTVTSATMDLGTKVTPIDEYLIALKTLYDARAKGPLNAAQENEFTCQLEKLWEMLDEYDRMIAEEITERFKARQ